MPTYQWAGLELSAGFAIPELLRAPAARRRSSAAGPERRWTIVRTRKATRTRADVRWFHHWTLPNGRRWLSLARSDDGYLLRFSRLADFVVDLRDREVRTQRRRTTPHHTFRHLLLDQVLPLLAGGADCLALHASVVNVDGGAVAFLGAARQGKSTLAASLSRRGHRLVSDDCCVIRRNGRSFDVWPTYPGVRLFGESHERVFGDAPTRSHRVSHYSTKRRVIDEAAPRRFSTTPVALRRVYVIADRAVCESATRVQIARRSRRDSVVDLVGGAFFLDATDPARALDAFGFAADIASSLPVRVLTFPWDLAALDRIADDVLADLRR